MPASETLVPSAPAAASGTVASIDATAGRITIAHGAVASLDWPPMTMAFKATPQQQASVRVGEAVQFEFVARGMDATLTRITPTQ
jgi:Cu(I)/Ag(I) efflux system protein CusF